MECSADHPAFSIRFLIFFSKVDILSFSAAIRSFSAVSFAASAAAFSAALRLQRYINMVDRSYQKIHNGKKTKERLCE